MSAAGREDSPAAATGFVPAAWAPLNEAFRAYRRGESAAAVTVRNELEGPRKLPIRLFFRPEAELDGLHRTALRACRGRVLDVGAGAGATSLPLQRASHPVTALEPLPEAAAILRCRGVRDVQCGDAFTFDRPGAYDTALLVMNGSMIAGTLAGLDELLVRAATWLRPDGRLLMDSTDLRGGGDDTGEDGRYVGEVHYQLEYRGRKGPPFSQLFVDRDALARSGLRAGFRCRILDQHGQGRFLAELSRVGQADPR